MAKHTPASTRRLAELYADRAVLDSTIDILRGSDDPNGPALRQLASDLAGLQDLPGALDLPSPEQLYSEAVERAQNEMIEQEAIVREHRANLTQRLVR